MDDYISRKEHEVFSELMKTENKRLSDENDRQNKRIEILENNVLQIQTLTTSVKELAVSMKGMVKEQEKQGERLETLEKRDGEMWRKVTGYIVTAIIGIIIGYIFKQIGM